MDEERLYDAVLSVRRRPRRVSPRGLIPADQRLDIEKIIKAALPAHEDDGMRHGARQVFAVFSVPRDAMLYATPIGMIDGSEEQYFCDLLFYYDDPRTIYDWTQDLWASIDVHQVKPGMSELEACTALGQKGRDRRRQRR